LASYIALPIFLFFNASTELMERTMSGSATPTASDLSRQLALVVDRVAPHVVAVHSGSRHASSGVFWTPELILTAETALGREEEVTITLPNGKSAEGTLVGRDPSTDVALLRLDAAAGPSTALLPADRVSTGHLALSIGRCRDGVLAGFGIVGLASGPWRTMHGGEIDQLLHVSVTLESRCEGGAVVDADGRLIGMLAFGPRGRVLAIPAATLARSVPLLSEHGRIARGYLGAGLRPIHLGEEAAKAMQRSSDRAAIVVSIDPDGPAKRAGLVLGDIITSWDGEPVTGVRDVMARLGPSSVGRVVAMTLLRAGSNKQVSLAIGERPRPNG
jgi:S1-C subfamily serine protease